MKTYAIHGKKLFLPQQRDPEKIKAVKIRTIEVLITLASLIAVFVGFYNVPTATKSVELVSEMAVYFAIFIILAFLVFMIESFDFDPHNSFIKMLFGPFRWFATMLMFIFFGVVFSFLLVVGIVGIGLFAGAVWQLQIFVMLPCFVFFGWIGLYGFYKKR